MDGDARILRTSVGTAGAAAATAADGAAAVVADGGARGGAAVVAGATVVAGAASTISIVLYLKVLSSGHMIGVRCAFPICLAASGNCPPVREASRCVSDDR